MSRQTTVIILDAMGLDDPTPEQLSAVRVIEHTWHSALITWLSGRASIAQVKIDIETVCRLIDLTDPDRGERDTRGVRERPAAGATGRSRRGGCRRPVPVGRTARHGLSVGHRQQPRLCGPLGVPSAYGGGLRPVGRLLSPWEQPAADSTGSRVRRAMGVAHTHRSREART